MVMNEIEAEKPRMCIWTYRDDMWESACGVSFVFTDNETDLAAHDYNFCHKCGKRIISWGAGS